MNHILTQCPICRLSVFEPAEYCRRCGCHLLLLEKVRQESEKLAAEGKLEQSFALYRQAATEKPRDQQDLPKKAELPIILDMALESGLEVQPFELD